jgi:glycosyltransferase involved in cell wall biosynthesis
MTASAAPVAGVVALIPALNEAPSIGAVVRDLAELGVRDVVVVDNGSTDGTDAEARSAGAEVLHEPRRGYGAACLRGMEALARRPTPPKVVLFLDGDRSDDPGSVRRVLDPVLDEDADLVIGVRAGTDGGALHAMGGTALVLGVARWAHGLKARDLGPFRAISWGALSALEMDDTTWGWTLQMQLRAHRAGMRTREVIVPRRPRAAGKSKVSGSLFVSLRAGGKMFWTLFRERFRPRPPWDGGSRANARKS